MISLCQVKTMNKDDIIVITLLLIFVLLITTTFYGLNLDNRLQCMRCHYNIKENNISLKIYNETHLQKIKTCIYCHRKCTNEQIQ